MTRSNRQRGVRARAKSRRVNVNAKRTLLALALLGVAATGVLWWWLNRLDGRVLDIAKAYHAVLRERIPNRRYLTVIDFTKPSFARRMHVVDLGSGEVASYRVAHGSARQGGNLYVPRISNEPGSHASSAGLIVTAEEYHGRHGRSLRLDGLEPRNSKVRERAIVIHAASYVGPGAILANLTRNFVPRLGETQGCFAVSPQAIDEVIDRLRGGSLLYVHTGDE